jgi:hypothetical protein
MFTAASVTTAKKRQLKCPSTHKWINTMENYSATKWNEVLIHATTWKNLENYANEISQTQKNRYHMIPLI